MKIMKKLILLPLMLLAFSLTSCKKDSVEPRPEPTTIDSSYIYRSVFNYSTTTTTTTDINVQSVDTTFYTIAVNGVVKLSWSKNWTYKSNPDYSDIDNLGSILSIKSGDLIVYTIVHRSPRNITNYLFNCGISETRKSDSKVNMLFQGQYSAYIVDSSSPYYKIGYNSFVLILQHKIK